MGGFLEEALSGVLSDDKTQFIPIDAKVTRLILVTHSSYVLERLREHGRSKDRAVATRGDRSGSREPLVTFLPTHQHPPCCTCVCLQIPCFNTYC